MIDERVDGSTFWLIVLSSSVNRAGVRLLVDLCLAHVGSLKAVMITCKQFRTQFAIERARYAAARGC